MAKTLLLKLVFKNNEYLAKPLTYHQANKNCIYDFHIIRGDLWGGRFQVSVIEGGQNTAGKEMGPSGRKEAICSGYVKLISSAIVTTTGGRSPSGGGEIFPRG
ncbi:MAG: hypothetical protein WBQ36_14920 [Desulfobaccales bacterium]